MGCKNCKKNKKLQGSFNGAANNVPYDIEAQKRKLINENVDMRKSLFNNTEQILITVFGWIPVIIGYFTIIRFFISLF
jgi:hypothetical protein|tara:strand:- start:1911 stop:2144 length:234 start_codon:yes stop_codon:yes gene_type:complete